MTLAHELMNHDPPTVAPDLGVRELARMLLESGRDGYCVVDNGKLVGVVTAMDLIFQEKQVHVPSFFAFLDGLLPLGQHRLEEELQKVTGARVSDIMTTDPVVVGQNDQVDAVATLMVEKRLTIIPIVRDDALVGEITKPLLLAHALTHLQAR